MLWFRSFPPLPLACGHGNTASAPWPDDRTPLGQTVPCLLTPFVTRTVRGKLSAGRSGQAEMPDFSGVSPPGQVVPGLHPVFICLKVDL